MEYRQYISNDEQVKIKSQLDIMYYHDKLMIFFHRNLFESNNFLFDLSIDFHRVNINQIQFDIDQLVDTIVFHMNE